MANPYFQFKQFTVWHDRCAMKVGTDAVLLGSWIHVENAQRLLDVGCGCGLIALMAAQRCPEGKIVAIEIDPDAAQQAKENVQSSPWADRIQVIQEDFAKFTDENKFDVIFSNPPYFANSLKCPNKERNKARHTDTLDFRTLMSRVKELLTPNGEFSVVIPMDASASLKAEAISQKLYLSREMHIHTKVGIPAKRTLLAFKKEMPESNVTPQQLTLETQAKVYTEEYKNMVNDFYL
jgi:tRNA1Val (adenine37-N6)-methyltransferase